MTFPKRILIALAAAAALLTACSSATDHSDMATLSEAVTTTNTLISDVVSVVSGFGSNPTIEEVAANYCSYLDEDIFLFTSFFTSFSPSLPVLFYEFDEEWALTNFRLATGTIACDSLTSIYTPEPHDALVLTWPAAGSDEMAELRFTWKELSKAVTYAYEDYFDPALYVHFFLTPLVTSEPFEIDVPSIIEITLDYRGERLVDIEVEQTWADTPCGRLVENRTLSASGSVRVGSQSIVLDRYALNHTQDNAASLELTGTMASGSLQIPFSAVINIMAGSVTRNSQHCQLNGAEGPLEGSVNLRVGTAGNGLGLRFDWHLDFEGSDLERLTSLRITGARLDVGRRFVRIDNILNDFRGNQYFTIGPVHLTFADRSRVLIEDFLEMLRFPNF